MNSRRFTLSPRRAGRRSAEARAVPLTTGHGLGAIGRVRFPIPRSSLAFPVAHVPQLVCVHHQKARPRHLFGTAICSNPAANICGILVDHPLCHHRTRVENTAILACHMERETRVFTKAKLFFRNIGGDQRAGRNALAANFNFSALARDRSPARHVFLDQATAIIIDNNPLVVGGGRFWRSRPRLWDRPTVEEVREFVAAKLRRHQGEGRAAKEDEAFHHGLSFMSWRNDTTLQSRSSWVQAIVWTTILP
jgi:hypothetical protein